MSARTASTNCSPLVIETTHHHWCAIGTREQLLEAGICTPAHFPEGKKRVSYGTEGGRFWELKLQRNRVWRLWVNRNEEDREASREAECSRKAAIDAPATPSAWRERVASNVECYLDGLLISLRDGFLSRAETGFCFDATTMSLLERQCELVKAQLRNGLVVGEKSEHLDLEANLQTQRANQMVRLRAPLTVVSSR